MARKVESADFSVGERRIDAGAHSGLIVMPIYSFSILRQHFHK
jgi:hypothetical protein